ncbi:hypothetical protein AVEN_2413-1 [Araneus ventricosus]|uniref:Uncharacterized protein n=1 Tax=Araneus ventricosus TaxID=182803 RepID=A0A4Y2CPW6_ARAVE|nr:hypothetical protein AVEN_2413-1 [Araneus ventricosus]
MVTNDSQEIFGPITLHSDKILGQIAFNEILLPGKITITKLLHLGKLGKNLNKSQNDKKHSNDKNKQNISLHISECKQINSHCSQITKDQVNLPQSVTENKCELRKEVKDIIKNFDSVFSKDKYDVVTLRVEPQRIVLNSDLPVSLRPYRTSPVEEQEIKNQIEKLLQAGLIKESNSP